jgi:hypothetical protein
VLGWKPGDIRVGTRRFRRTREVGAAVSAGRGVALLHVMRSPSGGRTRRERPDPENLPTTRSNLAFDRCQATVSGDKMTGKIEREGSSDAGTIEFVRAAKKRSQLTLFDQLRSHLRRGLRWPAG